MPAVISSGSEAAPSMLSLARRYAALFEAIGFLCVMVAYVIGESLKLNHGVLIYGRDDTYIHMSIARHLVLDHVWGVTPYAFVSASSSPLWTSLLAASFWLFGVGDKAPLVLSLLSAIGLLILIYNLLRRAALNETEITVILFAVVFAMPMPYLVLDAMEPALHTIFTIAFLYCASELLSSDRSRRDAMALAILAPLNGSCTVRRIVSADDYRRPLRPQTPLFLRDFIAQPRRNPGRGHRHSFSDARRLDPAELCDAQRDLAIGKLARVGRASRIRRDGEACVVEDPISDHATRGGGVVPRRRSKQSWRAQSVRLAMFLGILFAHLTFAQVGRRFRYEAYLVVTGIYVLASCLRERWCVQLVAQLRNLSRRSALTSAATASLMLLVLLPLSVRGLSGLMLADRASHNCFEQQYQMARFARRFYQGQTSY